MYYLDSDRQDRHVDQLSINPNHLTENTLAQIDKNFIDSENFAQPDQKHEVLLSSDHFEQKNEQIDNDVDLSIKDSECSVVYNFSPDRQVIDKISTVDHKEEKVINPTCSKNFHPDQNRHTTDEVDQSSDSSDTDIVDIASLSEFEEIQDKVVGFWHKSHGYLRFVRLQGKRIFGRRSGETKEIFCFWVGCTGKVELKKEEETSEEKS